MSLTWCTSSPLSATRNRPNPNIHRAGQLGGVALAEGVHVDQVTPITHLDTVHDLLRPRQTHVITHCGHMAPYERPDDVGDLLASFAVPHPDRLKP